MLVQISKTEAVNPFWVIDVSDESGKIYVVLGNPGREGASKVNYFVFSDYSFEETVRLINEGMKNG